MSSVPGLKPTVFAGSESALPERRETVYSGPAAPLRQTGVIDLPAGPKSETLYDPANHQARNTGVTVARAAVAKQSRRFTYSFFVTAALALLEFVMFRAQHPALAYMALVVAAGFAVTGFYTLKLKREAFLAALAVYGLSTLVIVVKMFVNGFDIVFFGPPLLFRCLSLYNLWHQYLTLHELHELENQ